MVGEGWSLSRGVMGKVGGEMGGRNSVNPEVMVRRVGELEIGLCVCELWMSKRTLHRGVLGVGPVERREKHFGGSHENNIL
jgi:hypothetical protein